MIILKATEKLSLHPLSLEDTFLEKQHRGGQIQIDPPSPIKFLRPDSASLIA